MIEAIWGAATDIGRVRSRNEDAYAAGPSLWAVADGMGGYRRGDLASSLAISALHTEETVPRGDLLDRIRGANASIADAAAAAGDPMGTTLCGLMLTGDPGDGALLVFNVGDSRAYRYRPASGLEQLTHDHSVVQELIDAGRLTPAGAATHPERNVVTRSLGIQGHLDIDWRTVDAEPGDRFVICSDGLSKELDQDTILGVLTQSTDPQRAADTLVTTALASGGRDNVTVVVVEIVTVSPAPADAEDTSPRDLGLDAPTNEVSA